MSCDGEIDIGDLLAALGDGDLLDGFTLGDLLLAFLDPGSLAYGGVEFADVDVSAPPERHGRLGHVRRRLHPDGEHAPYGRARSSRRPAHAGYVPGSGQHLGRRRRPDPTRADRFGDVLDLVVRRRSRASPTRSRSTCCPTLPLGSTSLSGVGPRRRHRASSVPGIGEHDGRRGHRAQRLHAPSARPPRPSRTSSTSPTSPTPTTSTCSRSTVGQNDELVVELSNLDADLDLVLWGRRLERHRAAALGLARATAPLFAVTDPDGSTADVEPLDDFRRLDDGRPDARGHRRLERRRDRRRDAQHRSPRRRDLLHPGLRRERRRPTCSRRRSSSRCSRPTQRPACRADRHLAVHRRSRP